MSILKTYLANVASAIKEKKGTSELINAQNFASEILSIQGGASLNLAYSLTPPTDTSKIWLQCEEPSSVEVQNYLGKASVGNVDNWGGIDNPVPSHSDFSIFYYSSCYIGNNQIAIVGYNHIRIYNLTTKSYIADYTISVGTSSYYTSNVLFKDNVLYFGYQGCLYSFDLSTQTLTILRNFGTSSHNINYMFFNGNNYIDIFEYYSYSNGTSYHYRYNLNTNEYSTILSKSGSYFNRAIYAIKVNNTVYNFDMYKTTSTNYYYWKYNVSSNTFSDFTSFYDFMTKLGYNYYSVSYPIYDNERYIYLIGAWINGTGSDLIIKYDTVNDSFELLNNKLLGIKYNHFSLLIDNQVYMFGGQDGRKNQLDYFGISFPLNTDKVLITTNPDKTNNYLPLINTDKLKLNSNIASAYKGNAENLAEKVNAYYYDGTTWKGINCEDYVESESSGTGGGLNGGGGDATTDPVNPDTPVEI